MIKFIKKKLKQCQLRKKNILVLMTTAVDKKTVFEGSNSVGHQSNIASSYVGFGSYVGDKCILKNTKIGRYCSIGNRVEVLLNNHPSHTFVSTHPAFHRATHKLVKNMGLSFSDVDLFHNEELLSTGKQVNIGSDVWLGSDVKILSGVSISDGAIIGAGSIVTKDIPPYCIAVGIPARVIKKRFTDADIDMLLELKWWDMPLSKLKQSYNKFSNIDNLR
ncbi:CatB-related O-acetyltransferase [Aliivibrio logei]|uniref:Acetyltransferase n=1 Tax=Aliivibrio logei 5S-186 TaxID=626086 RepID=A0ABX3AP43_ALILO|nr:CatB-related O-acetyltransferase [Aliivibrio logei]OEF09492.1 hypothetical protein A1Q5_14545 [Aliivibrio logei 5S-186]